MTVFRLLTNIQDANLNGIRLHCHAVLLEHPLGLSMERSQEGRIRGFSTSGSAAVFTFDLRCGPFDYEIEEGQSPHIFIGHEGKTRPLFSGFLLTFKDGTLLQLLSPYDGGPLDVSEYDEVTEVWKDLPARVMSHWGAPNAPVTLHLPKANALDALRSLGV